jgi:hypothetical protein
MHSTVCACLHGNRILEVSRGDSLWDVVVEWAAHRLQGCLSVASLVVPFDTTQETTLLIELLFPLILAA